MAILLIDFVILKLFPKKMETSFFVFIYVLNFALAAFGDYFLAGEPLNLYDTLDRNSGELFDYFLHLLVYPMTMLILLTVYAYVYQKKLWLTILFIVASAFILLGLEWVSTKYFNLFTYYKWNLGFSFGVYVLSVSINVFVYILLRRCYRKNQIKFV